jgi:hypothetical protein
MFCNLQKKFLQYIFLSGLLNQDAHKNGTKYFLLNKKMIALTVATHLLFLLIKVKGSLDPLMLDFMKISTFFWN